MKTYSRKKAVDKLKFQYNFEDVCRLCLSADGEKRPIFTSEEEISLSVKIMACAPVQIFEGDGLPAEICLQCVLQLENSYKFHQKCVNADLKLREFIKNTQHHIKDSCGGNSSIKASGEAIRTKSELNMKPVLYDFLTDVGRSCKELNTNSCTLTVSNTNSGSLLIACENTDVELVQSDDVMLIQNIQTALQCSDHNKGSEHENREESKWQEDNEPKDSQRLGEAIAAGFEILDHSQPLEEVQISSKQYEEDNNCLVLEAPNNHAVVGDESTCINIESECGAQESEKTGVISGDGALTTRCDSIKQALYFQCDKCNKRFSKRIELKRHSSVHDEKRGIVCDVCEKWFPNKTSFRRHERIHTGERPYACMFCPKRFSQDAILSRHIMTHTGIKPFKCEICNKGFTQRDGLKLHVRRHGNDKPDMQQHGCPLCNKFFCHQSGLSRHLITHSGKTFDCNVCSRAFTDQSSWKRHFRRHFGPQNKPDQVHPNENIR